MSTNSQVVGEMAVRDLQKLLEQMLRQALRDYPITRGDYFIDDEGFLCFGSEAAYADYLAKQDRPPSEVKAYYLEGGVKVVYSDYEPTPEFLMELEETHRQLEAGVSMVEHQTLRKRLGV